MLNEQRRIVNVLFDLAQEIIYDDVPNFSYADSSRLENHPTATKLKAWIEKRYNSVAPAPKGKTLPVFLNCKNSLCEFDERSSRFNHVQNMAAVQLADELLSDSQLGLELFIRRFLPVREPSDSHKAEGLENLFALQGAVSILEHLGRTRYPLTKLPVEILSKSPFFSYSSYEKKRKKN